MQRDSADEFRITLKVTRTTSTLLMLWDGRQLIDAAAGYRDNEELTMRLLGFRPTRHAPLGAAATLYAPAAPELGPDPDDDQAADDLAFD